MSIDYILGGSLTFFKNVSPALGVIILCLLILGKLKFKDRLNFIYENSGPEAIPEPVSWKFIIVSIFVDGLAILLGLCLISFGTQVAPQFLSSTKLELISTLFQAIAGILAITFSGLLLVTQLSSEKYSSVTVHRFQSHGTIHSILKIQIIALISSGITILTSFSEATSKDVLLLPNTVFVCLVFGLLSILALPPLLSITILQLRPRGLIKWSTLLAKKQIENLPSYSGKAKNEKKRLQWEMVVLHESLQSLRFIGVGATKDHDDEIVERVLGAFKEILSCYYQSISDYRGGSGKDHNFRTLWDAKVADRFIFDYDLKSGAVENLDSRWSYWVENNILRSIASMLETSVQTGGESNQKIRLFYDQWAEMIKDKGANTDVEYPEILRMVCSDLLVTYKSCFNSSGEFQGELLDFFFQRLEKILSICFPQANDTFSKDQQIRQLTEFLKNIGHIVIDSCEDHSLQKWLFWVDQLRKSLHDKDIQATVGDIIEGSFARVNFDLFLYALLSRNHKESKVILQHICFNEPPSVIIEIFKKAVQIMNSHFPNGNGKSVPNTYVRYDKYIYTVSKILILIVIYRRYIEAEQLTNVQIKWRECVAKFKESNCFSDIKKNSLPHLEKEIKYYCDERLDIAPKGAFDSYIVDAWNELLS